MIASTLAFSDIATLVSSNDTWVLDSGAYSSHMTGNKSLLSSLQRDTHLLLISIINGFLVPTLGIDTIYTTSNIELSHIFYMPSYQLIDCPYLL